MKRRHWIGWSLASYTLCLLATLPAHWGAVALAHFSQQRIQLIAPQGSIWQGQCQTLQVDAYRLSDFSWHLHMMPLLWLTAEAELGWENMAHGIISWHGSQHLDLRQTDAQLPIAWLAHFLPAVQEYGLGGELRITTPALTWDEKLSGTATLIWQQASTSRLPVQPLGTYQIQLNATPQGTVFNVQTLEGALSVTGTGRWLAHDRLRFNGGLRPDPARQAEFSNLLTLTGNQPDPQGTYRLAF